MSWLSTADGTQLFYTDWGQGRPIILLHGWLMNSSSWDYHAMRLVERGYRVIRYDRRGFGRSDQPWTGYDYDTLTSDLHTLIQHLGLRDAALVGFSMGAGEVARYLARHGNTAVSAAVFVSGITPQVAQSEANPDGMPSADFANYEQAMTENLSQTLYDYAQAQFPDPALREDYLTMTRQASLRAVLATARAWYETDFHADLATIDVPTLILHGDADQSALPAVTGRKTHALVAGSQYLEYPGIGHYLPFEAKQRLLNDLLAFLANGSKAV